MASVRARQGLPGPLVRVRDLQKGPDDAGRHRLAQQDNVFELTGTEGTFIGSPLTMGCLQQLSKRKEKGRKQ